MPLVPRTVPTHLRTADKLVDLGLASLSAPQALTLVAAGLVAVELLVDVPGLPLPLRQALATAAIVLGLLVAWWRIDGKSLGAWLLVLLRYARFPRQAVWRPAPLPLDGASDGRWHEVTPSLAWRARTRS